MGTPMKPNNNKGKAKTPSPKTKASYAMLPTTLQHTTPKLTSGNRFQLLDDEVSSSFKPQNYQQALTKTAGPSSPAPTLPTTPLPQIMQPPQYFKKENTLFVQIAEPEYLGSSLQDTFSNMLPKDFNFLPDDVLKTRLFYEFILVDTDSAEITHNCDKNNPSRIAFSKCKIKRVLRPLDWHGAPFSKRLFSQPFIPQEFSYHDYQQAWYNTFYLEHATHSWFFIFDRTCPKTFPKWFHHWFDFFGLDSRIFPPSVLEGFNLFKNNLRNTENALLAFSHNFLLAWIMSWQFLLNNNALQTNRSPFYGELRREFFVKWWSSFSIQKVCPPAIQQWFILHPQEGSSRESTNFMARRARLLQEFAQCESSEQANKIFQQLMGPSSSTHSQTSSTESPEDLDDINTFGLFQKQIQN